MFTLLFACATHTTASLESAVSSQPPTQQEELPVVQFDPGGSPCMDAIMAYYAQAGCLSVGQAGVGIDTTGIYMQCTIALSPTEYSQPTYYVVTNEARRLGAAGLQDGISLFCMDSWFSVYTKVGEE